MLNRFFKPQLAALVMILFGACMAGADESVQTILIKLTTLQGIPIQSIPVNSFDTVYIHLYEKGSGEELRCNSDINVRRIQISDEDGAVVKSFLPLCRTNLGGVLSGGLQLSRRGNFVISAELVDSHLQVQPAQVTVN